MHRSQFSPRERKQRSRLTQVIHSSRFLRGTSLSGAFAVANRIAIARGESRTLVSTWCDGREGNCARSSCPRNGKIACGKPSRITRRWKS